MAEIPMGSQLYLGRGLDPVTGAVHAVGVDFDGTQVLNTGQRVVFQLQSISSSRELTESLNISASASLNMGVGGVSAEVGLASSKQVNSFYTYALVRVVVINPPETVRHARLTQAAYELLQKHGWDAFAGSFGSDYVDGYISGGSYYALIEIQTSSIAEQRNVRTKLSGFYGPFKAEGEFRLALEEVARVSVVNVSVTQSGGTGAVVATDITGMLEAARNFPTIAKNDPVPITALTASYRGNVALPPIPPPDSLPRIHQKNTLNDLGRAYMRLRDYMANASFVLSHIADFDQFRSLSPEEIATKHAEFAQSAEAIREEIDAIVAQAAACAADYAHCKAYVLKVKLLPLPTIGGDLLNLKQIEEKLTALETRLTTEHGGSLELGGTSTAPGGGTPHIDFHHGHLMEDYNARIVNDANGQLSLVAQQARVTGDLILDPNRTIRAPGRLHIAGEEFLFLLNRSGVVISRGWGGNGNLSVEGDGTLAGRMSMLGDCTVQGRLGVAGQPTEPRRADWGGGIRTWDIEVEGTGWSRHGWQSGPRDVAENYTASCLLEPGEVVCFDGDERTVRRSEAPNDPMVCGVVSTEPGILLNAPCDPPFSDELTLPVALVGRVPCRVVNENGPIVQGDLLTTSSTPGRAMKASSVFGSDSPVFASGTLIGKALQATDRDQDVIEVFIMTR